MANNSTTATTAQTGMPKKEPDWMESLAGQLQYVSTGERAALRRLGLTRSAGADGTIIRMLTSAKVPAGLQEKDFDRWHLVAHVAAVLAGTGAEMAHSGTARLGRSLHAADYSENRLLRLLAVRGEALHDQVRRAARVLAQKRKMPVDLWPFYHLLGDDAEAAEKARVRIAHDYYAAEARSKTEAANDD